jgi:hypothetical protein
VRVILFQTWGCASALTHFRLTQTTVHASFQDALSINKKCCNFRIIRRKQQALSDVFGLEAGILKGCLNGSPGVPCTRGTLGFEGNGSAPCKGA